MVQTIGEYVMPKCVICQYRLHPDWCIEENIRGDEVKICLFCKLDKKELTVVDKETDKIKEIVTKVQAVANYKRYLEMLSKKRRIAEILAKEKTSDKKVM